MIRPTRLTALLAVVATLVALAVDDGFYTGPDRLGLLAGVAAVCFGQLAPLRLRVGASSIQMAWGEAAIIVACVWLPAAFVPAAVLVGVTIAHVARSIFMTRRPAIDVVFNIAQLTVAGCIATAAITAINPSYEVRLDVHTVVALCAGAVAWF